MTTARIADRYTVTGELGRGGMAAVFRARDDRHGRDVALKVILPAIAESVGAERFLREIETAAFFVTFSGDLETGLRVAREGRRLDPLGFVGHLTEAVILTYSGRYDEGLPLAERPTEFDPEFPDGHHIAGYIELSRGGHARAVEHLDRAIELTHRASWPVAKKGCALVGLRRTDEARALLEELEQRAETDPTICAPAIATMHLHLGDHDAFYDWMHRALDQRGPYALSLRVENLWDRARGEPRFRELLERVGLAES